VEQQFLETQYECKRLLKEIGSTRRHTADAESKQRRCMAHLREDMKLVKADASKVLNEMATQLHGVLECIQVM
jgi:hypothetical protein